MKAPYSRNHAFTLVELLTVLAVISLLGCLLLPAMARTRNRSYDAGCLSGLRQMMTGWEMYKDENNDLLISNAPAGTSAWVQGTENWNSANANTNPIPYLTSLLAPYINNHIESYRCPADVIPSSNGTRLRSRSMNGMVGWTGAQYSPGWMDYFKGSDITCPQPKDLFIFADESMYSLNDGYLQVDLTAPVYPDVPANYHDGACGISFADGHAEIHKWLFSSPIGGLLTVPYTNGVGYPQGNRPSSVGDVDYLWLRAHSACKPQ